MKLANWWSLLLSMQLVVGGVWAQTTRPQTRPQVTDEAEEVEEVEEIEEVDVVPAPSRGSQSVATRDKSVGVAEYFGRFHPAIVHIPIGWLVLLLLFDLAALLFRRQELLEAGLYLHIGTVFSLAVAVVSGLIRASHLPPDAELTALMTTHRNLMFAVAAICLAALVVRLWKKNRLQGAVKFAYLAIMACAVLLLAYGGHVGGKMVYGTRYLPF